MIYLCCFITFTIIILTIVVVFVVVIVIVIVIVIIIIVLNTTMIIIIVVSFSEPSLNSVTKWVERSQPLDQWSTKLSRYSSS